ncbi:hypothetical protein FE394_06345 [Xenorhabdus sp. Reich]|uniref:Uncharacterized protein n=1 Tax=Xenorhabdus littoralis TaxID=2582835 RepID=A0ABU4SJU0_9GAMM|nr:hypothetical protein [Xenorhabdus sp. psl]MDX7998820.1 hypothetical protein [Xenorhabdus sp. Reich]
MGCGRLVRLRSPSQHIFVTEKTVTEKTHIFSVKKLTEIGSSRQTQDPQRWRSIRPHSPMLKSRTTKI